MAFAAPALRKAAGVVTLDALTFTITNRQGETVALAVVATQARYASTLSVRGGRIDRRFATPAMWREIEAEIAVGLPKSALPPSSVLTRLLADVNERQTVQWLHAAPVEVERPEMAAEALDGHLRRQAVELRLRLKHEVPRDVS